MRASDTLEHQPTVWPVPYACAKPYKQLSMAATMGCHCPSDMVVRMRKVLTRPWAGVRVCHLVILFVFFFVKLKPENKALISQLPKEHSHGILRFF